ncbi:MAG: hypothetical protein RL338_926 [Chloroflexota bacterium]
MAVAVEPERARPRAGVETPATIARDGDALRGYLAASLEPHPVLLRWAIVVRPAPADEAALLSAARDLLVEARRDRERLAIRTGDTAADALLDALAPLLGDLLVDLTQRQREVARLILVDGLRQSQVAARLGVARATISVMTARGHLRSIARLVTAIRLVVGERTAAAAAPAEPPR